MQTEICTWTQPGAKVKHLHKKYGAKFAYVSKSVHMDRFSHANKFAYMQKSTHECIFVHVNGTITTLNIRCRLGKSIYSNRARYVLKCDVIEIRN